MTMSKEGQTQQIKPAEVAKQIKRLLKELSEPRADVARLDELRRIFTQLNDVGELTFPKTTTITTTKSGSRSVAAKWSTFLHNSHDTMVSQLCERVKLGRHASIRCLWGVIAGSPKGLSSSYRYVNAELLEKWMCAMTSQESTEMDKGMTNMVDNELLRPYRDIQYYSLGVITKLATSVYNDDGDSDDDDDDEKSSNEKKTRVAGKLLELLMMIPVPRSEEDLEGSHQFLFPPPSDAVPAEKSDDDEESEDDDEDGDSDSDDDDDDNSSSDDDDNSEKNEVSSSIRPKKRQKTKKADNNNKFAFQQIRMFKREYKKAWLAVLRLPLPVTLLKKALNFLPQNVLNYVAQPLRFADFFMEAYSDNNNSGGIIGVLALEGLFLLITKYGLEYSNFYTQLYKLVSAKVMYAKYRARFFSLMTKCLVLNTMLPAHLVAAFIKRLCRCTLSGPPSGALFVLALVSNLLKKHPECSCLVQRKAGITEMEDCFLADEDDPVECRALQSSLWELAVFERHYYSAVSTLAKSIGRAEEDKAPLYNVEEFAAHTYGSLFDQEKKKKNKTALTFKKPTSLFTEDDVFSGCIQIGDH